MKKILAYCKDMLPLISSGLAVLLIISVLVTSQPEVKEVQAFTPAPLKIRESQGGQTASKKEKKKKNPFEIKKKELPEKTDSGAAPADQPEVAFDDSGTYKDGSYTGSARGFGGTISVRVTIKDGKITSIDVTGASGETGSYFARAKGLLKSIISKQSPNVDVVSGATYSSKGLINAVKAALNKARTDGAETEEESTEEESSETEKETKEIKPVKPSKDGFKDGTFVGTGTGFGGKIKVRVTIKKGKIKKIEILSACKETPEYLKKAKKLIPKVVKKQSTDVDTISGATYSSNGILEAINNALSKAYKNPKETKPVKKPTREETKPTEKPTRHETKPHKPVTPTEDGYKDGTFTGSGEGFGGIIKVSVTIKKGKITKITIVSAKDETPEFFSKAKGILPYIISAQSTDVDTISGATFSSEGILEAVDNALRKALKNPSETKPSRRETTRAETEDPADDETENSEEESEEESSKDPSKDPTEESPEESEAETSPTESQEHVQVYKDGTWTGSATCQNYNYKVTASVVIEDDVIKSVSITTNDGGSNGSYISYAVDGYTKRGKHVPGVPEQIVSKQGLTGVDVIASATYTSNAIKQAVKQALEAAKN